MQDAVVDDRNCCQTRNGVRGAGEVEIVMESTSARLKAQMIAQGRAIAFVLLVVLILLLLLQPPRQPPSRHPRRIG
jgi:hypothetical protein